MASTILEEARTELQQKLRNLGEITDEQAGEIIKKYVAAIQGQFIGYMSAAALYSKSLHARFACQENLDCEFQDQHQELLREFSKSVEARPSKEDFERVCKETQEIESLISTRNGLSCLSIVASMEVLSLEFIPFLKKLNQQLTTTDSKYLEVHGIADQKHAKQLEDALNFESKHYNESELIIKHSIRAVENLFDKIFTTSFANTPLAQRS